MTQYTCPNGCDLRGYPIPQEYIDKGHYGPPDEAPTHYSRVVGVEVPGVYDGIAYWLCPDCGDRWHRWQQGRVHDAVEAAWKEQDA